MSEDQKCHDCGTGKGHRHTYGCDMEICPFCLSQLICCKCVYRILRIDVREDSWAFENGLTQEQENIWLLLLEKRGRLPYYNFCY